MSSTPLFFRALGVRRMPGITDGGFDLQDLSPGVNVVWGPNGVGKTTTATALERLLWPASVRTGRPLLDARFTLGGADWRVDLEGATARYQCDGQDAPSISGLPPAADRDRYRLSLHELLTAGDESLAQRILQESAGGYDVGRACSELKFRRDASRATTESGALRQARADRDEIVREEADLRTDEARLQVLTPELADAESEALRRELWERALDRLDAGEEERIARAALESYPPEVAGLRGDEAERLRALREALEDAVGRAGDAQGEIDAARRALGETRLAEEGIPGDVIPRIEAVLKEVDDLRRAVLQCERDLSEASEAARLEGRNLAGAIGEDRLTSIRLPEVEELARFAREAEQHRAGLKAVEAELRWLSTSSEAEDAEGLRRGRDTLAAWLCQPGAEDRARARYRMLALLSGGLALVAGTALGIGVHPAWFVVAALAGVLLCIVLFFRPDGEGRTERQQAYERLGLDLPARWEPAEVEVLLDRLEGRIAEARYQGVRTQFRAAAEARRGEAGVEGARLAAEREALARRVGVAPDMDEAALAYLCQRIARWQDAKSRADQAEAALGTAREQHERALSELARWISPYVVAEVSSAAELTGTLADLRERQQAHAQATIRLDAALASLRTAGEQVEKLKVECATLLARAGLPEDGDSEMERLCRLHGDYAAARERHVRAEQDLRTSERRLEETSGCDDEVRGAARGAVLAALERSRDAAGRLDALRGERADLEARLRAARERCDMETAIARVETAEQGLRECRDRDEALVAGWVLSEYVQRETRDRDRPQVFHRARELFAGITHGRYRLDLSDEEVPEFRAVDTRTGLGCSLDELSRGSRVQLLLAVRIAFIETMEMGVRLPLVLDETLGNSDPHRAEAVMQAVVSLAREGRQIFYFTARADEAERWVAHLAAADAPHCLLDLGEARRLARWSELPERPDFHAAAAPVPEPGGMTHVEYGNALRVPRIDPDSTHPDDVHLWYLVDEPELLHRLLRLGADTWGQLRTLVELAGHSHLGEDATVYTRMEARARGVRHLLEARRVGRGRRVDPEALLRSGAITNAFLDRAERLRQTCEGRADRLFEGIQNLPRFRSDAAAALRDFLEREGYLDTREPLDDGRVRMELLGCLGPDLRDGHCTPGDVDHLLSLVPAMN